MKFRIGALLLVTLAGSGCGSLAPRAPQPDPSAHEIAALRAEVVELQKRAVMAEIEVDRLRQLVVELRASGAVAQTAPTPDPVRDLNADEPRPEPVAAIEQVDLPPVPPPASAAPASPPSASPVGGSAPQAATPAPTPAPIPAEAQGIYDRGYTLYHQGRYLDAEASFQTFLRSYPENELADNAQYWIGESRFARGDYPGALAAFRETVDRFAQGNKVPDAMLKIGDCLARTGDAAGARRYYEDVVRRFPGSAASATAEERLETSP